MTKFALLLITVLFLAACQPEEEPEALIVYVEVDNLERTWQVPNSMTVEDFLNEAQIELDDNDRIVPPLFTQIVDGIRITIVRVEQEESCEQEEIPFEIEIIPNEAFAPGEERVSRSGTAGQQRVCYRITYENGELVSQQQIGQPEVIVEPVNEIRVVGVDQTVEPFPITGTLAYINNGNAWVIQRTSTDKRPLTTTSDLDSLAFALSPNGDHLIYTREPAEPETFVNELWLIPTNATGQPVQLNPTNVLTAEWLPNQEDTIAYSTSEPQELFPFWRALNSVWVERIDPATGESLSVRQVVAESGGGLYGWWGTIYHWSPDGERLAWVQADGMGIFAEDGTQERLVEYNNFRNLQNWSWRSNVSWSPDGSLLATTVHGDPLGNEPPDTSPVFNVVVTDVSGNFEAVIDEGAGMWSSPKFSPFIAADGENITGYLAYWRARDPNASVYGEYDLVVADRDGSNARVIFPPQGLAGLTWTDFGLAPQDYVWSPDGQQIAVIYDGNLWVVDAVSGTSNQLTFDGGSENPTWSN